MAASELVTTLTIVVLKPFSLFKLICLFCARTTLIVLQTWVDLAGAAISLHVKIFWKVVLWTVALITLPFRILTAVQREKQLEVSLQAMQIELENFIWERKELEEHCHKAVKERKMMEFMLSELEEENEKIISRLKMLEDELQRMKNENLRLKEMQGKELWSIRALAETGHSQNISAGDDTGIPHGIPPSKPSYNGRATIFRELLRHGDIWEGDRKTIDALLNVLSGVNSGRISSPEGVQRSDEMNKVLAQKKEVALKRSLFSALLSFMVGMTIWEAKDPCMPLVMALFTVVGMSLASVVQCFSTIQNKPASDAVALLSLNWFMLGTLSYPTLPRVAQMLSPIVLTLLDRTLRWLGIPAY